MEIARNFTAAKRVFDEIDDTLDQHLFKLMTEGSSAELTLTANAQPAIFAVSLAIVRAVENELGRPLAPQVAAPIRDADDAGDSDNTGRGMAGNAPAPSLVVAGHSLGEYAALTVANAFTIGEAARLLRARGRAMQRAVPEGEGAMLSVLSLDVPTIERLCQEVETDFAESDAVCAIAGDNIEGQVVISGSADAIAIAAERIKDAGARKVVPLAVSAPFHCAMMAPAAEAMKEALDKCPPRAVTVPVITNVRAMPVLDAHDLKQDLVDQVCQRVRWRETLGWLANAFAEDQPDPTRADTQVVEFGHGKVLTSMAKRHPNIAIRAVNSVESIDGFVKQLG